MHGASLAEVAEALGHRTLALAKRYSPKWRTRSLDLERIADRRTMANLTLR
jgi:hypothetical protein